MHVEVQERFTPGHDSITAAPAATAAWPSLCTVLRSSCAVRADGRSAEGQAEHAAARLRELPTERVDKLAIVPLLVSQE